MRKSRSPPIPDRRTRAPERDPLFRVMVLSNVFSWLVFTVALVVFHWARPEFVTGLQKFWGDTQAPAWDLTLSAWLVGLLILCLISALWVLFLHRRRARRRNDPMGINAMVLALFCLIASSWLLLKLW